MIGDIGMTHFCSIIRKTQTSQDEYGSPVYADSTVITSCRFFHNNSNSRILVPDSGEHVVSTPAVLLPAAVSISEGDTIVGEIAGFTKTYRVTAVKPIYWMLSNVIHHYECDLKAVE
ncbi:MAG: putative minor capsid protein [Methanolobus sp.]|uniref:putative minor capsid protein n=1 Tax=Methanolobus sp. TaxID=1874737 RepID=UPI002730FF9F|nr:putative minor capsid protein [Methanolobus sp.]MDP2217397.1 putative minor capsid protein [Methanolobus sp.]